MVMVNSGVIPLLHFITELSLGGAQMALWRLLCHLDRTRFSPEVVCLYNGDGAVAQRIRELGIPVTDLHMTNKIRWDRLGHFYTLLRQKRPLILHTWMFHANIPGRVLGRLAGVPIIISSERTMGQEGTVRRLLNRITAPWTSQIICVSQRVADFAIQQIGLPSRKVTVVANGIDLARFTNLPTSQEARRMFGLPAAGMIVGAIGRPRPVKGYDILLEAFAQVASLQENTQLLFVGEGPDRAALEQQTARLGLQERVLFLGDQHKIPHLLPALDLLALPSRHEGMPNVVLEAMAAKVAVVATAVGGTPEVVIDGETGLLVPPGNAGRLAAAIQMLLTDRQQREAMGLAGQERVDRYFNIERTVSRTQEIYESLLHRTNQAGRA